MIAIPRGKDPTGIGEPTTVLVVTSITDTVESLAADFPNAKVITANGTKDLADLHKKEGKRFRKALREHMDAASPIGSRPPTVTFDAAVGSVLDGLIEDLQKPVDVVPTPLALWNSICRDEGGGKGLARGWNIAIGGSTDDGKSLIGGNLAVGASRQGEKVGNRLRA